MSDGEDWLLDSLTGANNVLLSYVEILKIAELDGRKQELLARIAELTWWKRQPGTGQPDFPATSTHGTAYPLTTSDGWWFDCHRCRHKLEQA